MDKKIKTWIDELASTDDKIRFTALHEILALTEHEVDWVYEPWDNLLAKLDNVNSYQRSIAIMILCNLAKSDREQRMALSLDRLLAHTKDEKFITSRQCIQNIWKVATVSKAARGRVLDHLQARFYDCTGEKHYNLIRLDIIQAIMCLYEVEKDEALLVIARGMVATEKEVKYRKAYEDALKLK